MDLLAHLVNDAACRAVADALAAGRTVAAEGAAGSSTTLLVGAIARLTGRAVVLVQGHLDDADEAADELASTGVRALRLPAMESLPGEGGVSVELFAERLAVVREVVGWGLAERDGSTKAQRHEGSATTDGGGAAGIVLICPIQALMQAVPRPARIEALARRLRRGDRVPPGELVRWLDAAGYKRQDAADEPGDFALRGGILDVFAVGGTAVRSGAATPTAEPISGAVRLDFFGDEIERITEIDSETMGSGAALEAIDLVCADLDAVRAEDAGVNFLELLPAGTICVLADTLEVTEQARGYYERVSDGRGLFGPPAVLKLLRERTRGLAVINPFSSAAAGGDVRVELPVSPLPSFAQEAAEGVRELKAMAAASRVRVVCQTGGELQRFGELLAESAPADGPIDAGNGPGAAADIEAGVGYLHRGFIWRGSGAGPPVTFVPYHELIHRYQTRRRAVRLRGARTADTFLDFAPGDIVVHAEHGIARFVGLKVMKPPRHREFAGGTDLEQIPEPLRALASPRGGEPQEYLTLEFAGGSKLHVPAITIDLVQKYVGGFSGKPPLSTLGGGRWKTQKARVSESVRDLAAEMLRVRAAREHMPGVRFPADTAWQREFEDQFPYEETEDQLAAMAEIKRDMQTERPMDRLICGDVGFGKTELAIRAAFKAVEFGKQVAVLVPTTVLAEQHERTLRSRFADYPFRIESLSRFKSDREANAVLAALRKGHVDIVIGTHRLLSNDVKFADLGLVVVDEEQRFGVEHKERLLRLRMTVDVLTLSATPIPRTLHMAMLGLRDISSLTTAPLDRRAIVTEVIPYNPRRIEQAIARELARDGQVYFVHNRISDIRSVADEVHKLSGGARIVVGHGQMPAHELEDVMLKFMRRDADILVSTTIIESGIDIASANTMFINDADRFGLADLHQLRGRVGRSKHRAYCYMLLAADRPVREIAQKRLKAIEQYSMLGAGFKIAMRDLEIRGAGNLLGAEQSGHIAAVGYDMYCRLLEQAVHELKHDTPKNIASLTTIDIGVSGLMPKAYIPSDQRRMEAYRRVSLAASPAELRKVADDLHGAYGPVPPPAQRLLDLAEVRVATADLGVRSATIRGADVLFRTDRPDALAARLNEGAPAKGATGDVPQVRVLPPPPGERLHEVYLRLPPAAMESVTLLAVLRKRLRVSQAAETPAPASKQAPAEREPAKPSRPRLEAGASGRHGPAAKPAAAPLRANGVRASSRPGSGHVE